MHRYSSAKNANSASSAFLRLPLDIAANRWFLICGYRLACKYLVNSGAQILAGDGDSVAGAALVKLSAVDEMEAFIKEKNIRCARGLIGMSHGLRLII